LHELMKQHNSNNTVTPFHFGTCLQGDEGLIELAEGEALPVVDAGHAARTC
jgi:hypothetical protein